MTERQENIGSARQASAEIEVTPEIVDAGLEVYGDLAFHEDTSERIVTEIFRAMMRARGELPSQTGAAKR